MNSGSVCVRGCLAPRFIHTQASTPSLRNSLHHLHRACLLRHIEPSNSKFVVLAFVLVFVVVFVLVAVSKFSSKLHVFSSKACVFNSKPRILSNHAVAFRDAFFVDAMVRWLRVSWRRGGGRSSE